MKTIYSLLLLTCLTLLVGCQNTDEGTMVLLDEKVIEVNVSESDGIGSINEDIIFTFNDEQSIQVFEKAIRTAVKQPSTISERIPDYDVLVEYEGGLPTHAIHLWLADEDEKSILMYMVGEGETYVTLTKATNQLRELLLSE